MANNANAVPGGSATTETTQPPTTVEEALGGLTEASIKGVTDAGTRATLEEAYAFAKGVASVYLADPSDPDTAYLISKLTEIHVDLADAVGVAGDAAHLIEEAADRDAKATSYHIAVGHVAESQSTIDKHLSSVAYLLRGKLGAKNPALLQFGVTPLAPGGRRAKKATAGGTTPAGTAPTGTSTPTK
ncbi:MAG: hypothetical protein WCI05_03010 [Myxococcales bacterium]|jgi:hypothetical protein